MAQDLRFIEGKMADLFAKADIVEEADGLTTYLGYCQRDPDGYDAPQWAICRLQYSDYNKPRTLTIMWPDGLNQRRYKWTERASLNYQHRRNF
jgi:hypothetical protein